MSESGGQIKSTHTGRIRIDYARGSLIITGQDGVDQLLAGINSDGSLSIDLAPDGVDVKTAELRDLVWSSRSKTFKIVETDVAQIASVNVIAGAETGSGAFITLERTYVKRPSVIVFLDSGSSSGALWNAGFFPIEYSFGPPGSPITIDTAVRRDIQVSNPDSAGGVQISLISLFINSASITKASPSYALRYYVIEDTSSTS